MVTGVPKPNVVQDLFDDAEFFDEADNDHFAITFGTYHRVHLIGFLNQASPILAELFGGHFIGDNGGDIIFL
jgi:hypothetical protein